MRLIFTNTRLLLAVLAAAVGSIALLLSVTAAPAHAAFGFATVDGQWTANPAGEAYTQAGGHPYAIVTTIKFNQHEDVEFRHLPAADAPAKDIFTSLPAGLVGNPSAVATCNWNQFTGIGTQQLGCPPGSQVGLVQLNDAGLQIVLPLYNLQAPSDVPARFGFNLGGTPVVLDASVRSGGDYGIDINARGISEALPLLSITLVIWGTPADSGHDVQRCSGTHFAEGEGEAAIPANLCTGALGDPLSGPNAAAVPPVPYITLPTRCTPTGVGLETSMRMDSWKEPGVFQEASFLTHKAPFFPAEVAERGPQVGTTGCALVPFEPALKAVPTTGAPASPSGLDVSLAIPTSGLEGAGIAQSELKKIVMRFPEGMTLNPAAAAGLGACTEAEIDLGSTGAAHCPESSKIGTVKVETPLLKEPMTGALYQAAQDANPFHATFAGYLVAEGPGVVLKLPGRFDLDPSTGRMTVTFDNEPQLPFANLQVSLKEGPRAPLMTPASCGEKAIVSELEGWSGKTVTESSEFTIECSPGLGGFAPAVVAGSQESQAGAFSPNLLSFSRNDAEQPISGFSETLAPGLLAKLAGVPLCSDADAAAGACPEASRIGTVTVGSGAGTNPLFLPGKVFLTGPYNGGPFGAAVVVPVVAGPFNLGDVVVRTSIRIDPLTAQATIVSDPLPPFVGGYGVPTDVRRVDVKLDRPGFSFNPTSCEPESIAATLTSAQGASANVSSRFQATNCATLAFHPSFTASTEGNGAFNQNGASLDVKIASGQGPDSHEANIHKVEVRLPKLLPSRLVTLQKACGESQFAANPAGCPAEANVGSAVVRTPLLASPLTGPAYLVSHGGQAFPDLVLILQGEGITLQITGHTQIKKGVTYSRFETVPDAPVASFELKLPEGQFSALAAGGSLCGKTVTGHRRVTRRVHGRRRSVRVKTTRHVAANLAMPTTITAQNGAVLRQTTHIAVTGCPKAHGKKAHGAARAHRSARS